VIEKNVLKALINGMRLIEFLNNLLRKSFTDHSVVSMIYYLWEMCVVLIKDLLIYVLNIHLYLTTIHFQSYVYSKNTFQLINMDDISIPAPLCNV